MTDTELKIRTETIAEIIEYLKDSAWRFDHVAQWVPEKRKKDQEAVLNRNKGFRMAIDNLEYCYTGNGRFTKEKFTANM